MSIRKGTIPIGVLKSDGGSGTSNYNDLTNKPTIPTALSELTTDSTHRVVNDIEKGTWNNKQNAINDLENIRSGASAGATALQSVPSSNSTTLGGLKVRLDGTTLYIRNDGSDA